jgi:mRNA-degrading endonuclease toxin of MazEF toxin-antitoxin module
MRGIHPPLGWFPKRGEVYFVQLNKPRPAIILSVDQLNRHALDVCIVGILHGKFSMRVPLRAKKGGLDFDCWAKCDQVTTLEKSLLRYPALGSLSASTMAIIEESPHRLWLGLTPRNSPQSPFRSNFHLDATPKYNMFITIYLVSISSGGNSAAFLFLRGGLHSRSWLCFCPSFSQDLSRETIRFQPALCLLVSSFI